VRKLTIGSFRQEACAGDSGPTRPLHQVERALRGRFRLWIQNRNGPESLNSIFSHSRATVGPDTILNLSSVQYVLWRSL
jgi:hypothetical protein